MRSIQRHLEVKLSITAENSLGSFSFLHFSFIPDTMIKCIKYMLLFATLAIAEKQLKLEDIERDNLLSERRVNRDEETVKNGESQHLLAPIYVGPTNEVMRLFQ